MGATGDRSLGPCLRTVEAQTVKPAAVLVASHSASRGQHRVARGKSMPSLQTIQTLSLPDADDQSATEAAVAHVLDALPHALGVVVLSPSDRLHAGFLETCEAVLAACPEVGVASCWALLAGRRAHHVDEAVSHFSARVRHARGRAVERDARQALREAGVGASASEPALPAPDLCLRIMAAGWAAVAVPAVLVNRRADIAQLVRPLDAAIYEAACRQTPHLAAWGRPGSPIAAGSLDGSQIRRRSGQLADRVAALGELVRNPRSTAAAVCWRLRNKLTRTLRTRQRSPRSKRPLRTDASPPIAS